MGEVPTLEIDLRSYSKLSMKAVMEEEVNSAIARKGLLNRWD